MRISRISRMSRVDGIGLAATVVVALAMGGCAALESGGGNPDAAVDELDVIVPAAPGGGWDQTGRALQTDLQAEGIVGSATVTNVDGAGGTVGLAKLANAPEPHTLMVTGMVMVGAVETNRSQARLEDTTPIARLTEEPMVVVVPAESEYETIGDLLDDIDRSGKDVAVAGGSAGGSDHVLAGQMLTAGGMEPADVEQKLNYIAYSGGGESLAALLGNKVDAGISGVAEYAEQIEAGTLRALATSGGERAELLPEVETLAEQDVDVELTNWRGVVAPGGIEDAERDALVAALDDLSQTEAWRTTLEENGWTDAYLAGDEFDTFLTDDVAEIQGVLADVGLTR